MPAAIKVHGPRQTHAEETAPELRIRGRGESDGNGDEERRASTHRQGSGFSSGCTPSGSGYLSVLSNIDTSW